VVYLGPILLGLGNRLLKPLIAGLQFLLQLLILLSQSNVLLFQLTSELGICNILLFTLPDFSDKKFEKLLFGGLSKACFLSERVLPSWRKALPALSTLLGDSRDIAGMDRPAGGKSNRGPRVDYLLVMSRWGRACSGSDDL